MKMRHRRARQAAILPRYRMARRMLRVARRGLCVLRRALKMHPRFLRSRPLPRPSGPTVVFRRRAPP